MKRDHEGRGMALDRDLNTFRLWPDQDVGGIPSARVARRNGGGRSDRDCADAGRQGELYLDGRRAAHRAPAVAGIGIGPQRRSDRAAVSLSV